MGVTLIFSWFTLLYCLSHTSRCPIRGQDWMQYLDNTRAINLINIPATHDTGCVSGKLAFAGTGKRLKGRTLKDQWAITQKWDIKTQLTNGIRYFDLRLRYVNKAGFKLAHGNFISSITLKSVITDIQGFLLANPSEFVMIKLKAEKLGKLQALEAKKTIGGHSPFINGITRTNRKISEWLIDNGGLWRAADHPTINPVLGNVHWFQASNNWNPPGGGGGAGHYTIPTVNAVRQSIIILIDDPVNLPAYNKLNVIAFVGLAPAQNRFEKKPKQLEQRITEMETDLNTALTNAPGNDFHRIQANTNSAKWKAVKVGKGMNTKGTAKWWARYLNKHLFNYLYDIWDNHLTFGGVNGGIGGIPAVPADLCVGGPHGGVAGAAVPLEYCLFGIIGMDFPTKPLVSLIIMTNMDLYENAAIKGYCAQYTRYFKKKRDQELPAVFQQWFNQPH